MFWTNKIPEAKRVALNDVEVFICNVLSQHLPVDLAKKIENQIPYLVLLKRIEYKNDNSTEFYPETFNSIPSDLMYEKKEELKIASIKFNLNDKSFICDCFMVLGVLFEIRIKPKIDFAKINNAKIELQNITVLDNLK